MRELANFQNVHCKVSGVVTEADHDKWTPEQIRPYLDHVFLTGGTYYLVIRDPDSAPQNDYELQLVLD